SNRTNGTAMRAQGDGGVDCSPLRHSPTRWLMVISASLLLVRASMLTRVVATGTPSRRSWVSLRAAGGPDQTEEPGQEEYQQRTQRRRQQIPGLVRGPVLRNFPRLERPA